MTTTNTTTTVAATETKLTKIQKLQARVEFLTKRIADDTAELPEVQAELEAQQKLAEVKEGSVIQIKQGRADTLRTVSATVKATKVEEDGTRLFKVEIGEGFDAETAVVRDSLIVGVVEL